MVHMPSNNYAALSVGVLTWRASSFARVKMVRAQLTAAGLKGGSERPSHELAATSVGCKAFKDQLV